MEPIEWDLPAHVHNSQESLQRWLCGFLWAELCASANMDNKCTVSHQKKVVFYNSLLYL